MRWWLVLVVAACSGKSAPPPPAVVVRDAGVDAGRVALTARQPPTRMLAPGRGGCVRDGAGAIQCWGWATPSATRLQWVPAKLDVGFADARGVANAAGGRCAWSDEGDVACWGESVQHPVHAIAGLHDVVEVTGDDPACARRRDGTVVCWQQVSIYADTPPHETLVEIPVTGVVELAGARRHPCARTASGEVKCWSMAEPTAVHAMPDVTGALSLAVVEGTGETGQPNDVMVALMPDGSLVAWETATNAARSFPALPATTDRIVAVQGTVCGLHASTGTVTCPDAGAIVVPRTLEHVVELAAGQGVTCAALRDRSVECWGHRGFLGDGDHEARMDPIAVPGLEHVAQLAGRAGGPMCVRHDDGSVACWGWQSAKAGRDGRPEVVPGVTAAEIAVTYGRACGRSAKGTVTCWGETYGPTRVWTTSPPAVQRSLAGATAVFELNEAMCATVQGATKCDRTPGLVPVPLPTLTGMWTAGSYQDRLACFRDASGVRCFRDRDGKNQWTPTDELGPVADARDFVFGDGMIAIVARHDGSVWRAEHGANAQVVGVNGAVALASAGDLDDPEGEVCALKAGGSVTCFAPDGAVRTLRGVSDAVEIAGTRGGKCVRRSAGSVMCWGARAMLGVGDTERASRSDPTMVTGVRT